MIKAIGVEDIESAYVGRTKSSCVCDSADPKVIEQAVLFINANLGLAKFGHDRRYLSVTVGNRTWAVWLRKPPEPKFPKLRKFTFTYEGRKAGDPPRAIAEVSDSRHFEETGLTVYSCRCEDWGQDFLLFHLATPQPRAEPFEFSDGSATVVTPL